MTLLWIYNILPSRKSKPTALKIGPYRFFFYAGDRDEPKHIHVECNDKIESFGLIRLECKAVADLVVPNLVKFIKSFKKTMLN